MKFKSRAKELISNFAYAIGSNAISVFVSILVVLVVPKFIGVDSYGYWQLYLLYTSFVGFLHFGWNDGLYLRLGGRDYKEIDKALLSSQFYMLLLTQITIAVFGIVLVNILDFGNEKAYVLWMTAVCMVIVNMRYMLLFLLQATYRIKAYSVVTIFDRFSYLLLVIILLTMGVQDFQYLIWVDIAGKVLSLILGILFCKDIVFRSFSRIGWQVSIVEAYNNIKVGIKLMLSNISSKLLVGNVRLGIEAGWSIAIFGKVSLMLSVTTFVMIFIQSISLVLFPFLKRVDKSFLVELYRPLRNLLLVLLLAFLFTYYPLSVGLKYWLPEYNDALVYLLILYPVVIFEGKVALLINTYFKVLRQEGLLLKVNFISLLASAVLTYISVFYFKNLEAAVFAILGIITFRSVVAETYLQEILNISLILDLFLEISLVWLFVICNMVLDGLYGLLIYLAFFVSYLLYKKDDLVESWFFVKKNAMIKSK